MADAVCVTDIHRRVVLWNDAADQLYGIPSSDAVGTPIDLLYDSTIIGEGTSSSGARTITLAEGSWRGRVADRPRIGRLVGQELVIETVLSRLHGPDGEAVGVLSVKRDVTPGVRVERELSTVVSLAGATGEHRTRQGAAAQAIAVLTKSTGATTAVIAVPDEAAIRILAHHGASELLLRVIREVPWVESPAVRAATPVGRVVKGSVSTLPVAPSTRRALLDGSVRTMVFVGMHRDDELIGVLMLGWDRDDPVIPSDAVILLAASHVARSLENARLVEELVRRAESERELGQRLRALDELTRVGDTVSTLDELAARSARLVNTALSAAGTAYGLLAPDGGSYGVTSFAQVRPAIAAWLEQARPDERSAFRRWRAGEGSFLEPFEAGLVTPEAMEVAKAAGVTAYAAIPIRVGDEVAGGIVAYFDRPPADLHIDRGALERVASIVSISLANFRLREALIASEQRYRSIFDASPDAMFVVTPEGVVVDANDATTALYGSDKPWLLGRRATDLARFDLVAVRERSDRLTVGETFRVRAVGVRLDGESFPAEVEVAAVALDGTRRFLIRVRDLTEQERLQAELIQAQKMEATGQLVSGVAHELNNPLAAILGFSQLIRRDPSLPEDLRHDADLLVEEATRTRRIVQNLLDFARQRPPERYPTAIPALIDSVLALQSYSLGKGGIEVELDVAPDLPLVELDRGQLQQVLVNLTHNAIYAIRHGGGSRVRLTAGREGPPEAPRVRITIMDDGPGVAPEHVDHLFEAFFTTKPPSDGTGLGLPVSYGIIASHGGELRYGPSALGRGAAFTFDLPVQAVVVEDLAGGGLLGAPVPGTAAPSARRHEPPEPPEPTEPPPPEAQRVLVLDDEGAIRLFLEKALRVLGYEPVVAERGEDAVRLASDGPYTAILCDHQMPVMSGVEIHQAIAAARPDLARRFVMMSGDVLNPSIAGFAAEHGVALLAKPFDLDTLDRTIRGVAGIHQRGGRGQRG
jgi:PAS domain S-box-containing protein